MATNKEKANKEEERKFIVECIELYETLPALWNIKNKDYSNRIKKNEQYELLLRKYKERYPDADKMQLIKKFNSLRTNFRKELKRIRDSEKSGAGVDDIIGPTLWYFEEMKFLVGQEEPSSSQNTIQTEDEDKEEPQNDIDGEDNIGTINTSTLNRTNGPSKKKTKRRNEADELISLARKHLEEPLTEYEKIASAWAIELQKMRPQQQLFAKKAINDILFEGQLGTLHRHSVQINSSSRASTPYNSMQPSPIYYDSLHTQSLHAVHSEIDNGNGPGPSHASQYFSNFC
ncbi:Alcohol dehydrogenase transcription factor Myb/SANT-like [Popillia japonica]|uniref:Alcohol dehydrogenase transcription factor Myb/SANT-like n=1 Tax=Popillia japonica TaxID=7064 RepID=A0AAW1HU51_POPJA